MHTHAIYLWPLWAAARAAYDAGVPYVVSPRGMLEKGLIEQKSAMLKAGLIAFIEKQTLERAAAVHVTSQREAEEAAAFGFDLPARARDPERRRPGCRRRAGRRRGPDRGGEPYVLFLGRINWKKGLDRLVTAFARAAACGS